MCKKSIYKYARICKLKITDVRNMESISPFRNPKYGLSIVFVKEKSVRSYL